MQATTLALIVGCVAVFIWQLTLSAQALGSFQTEYGLVPVALLQPAPASDAAWRPYASIATSLFLHNGWFHLVCNMAYLWVFGDNIEDAMGHWRFLVFYLLCGSIAAVAHAAGNAYSVSPLIGASGAVAGVMGAYVMLHPRVKILILAFSQILLRLPAYMLLMAWFAWQLYAAFTSVDSNIAWWAHVAGFVTGAVLVIPFKRSHVRLFDKGTEH